MVNINMEGTGVKHTKKECMSCGDVLISPDNWYISRVNKKEYRCITCFDHKRLENRIKKGEKSPSLYAKFFGIKHEKEYASIQEGYVYILTNPAWKGWIKVGMAVDAGDRCKQYQTSSPFRDYTLKFKKYFDDRRSAEQQAHKKIKNICKDNNGEWFKVSISEAKEIIQSI